MNNGLRRNRWIARIGTSLTLLILGCTVGDFQARAVDVKPPARPGVVSTLWATQKDDSKVTLITLNGEPTSASVQSETLIAGMCVHCNLMMEVSAGQIAKNCKRCACSSNSAECFVNKVSGKKSWADLLGALPKGVTLLAEYTEPGKPESGLKRLTIDSKTALLPIKCASPPSTDALAPLVKGVGGTSVEVGEDGKRLLVHLKSDWTQDKEIRLEKLLAQSGVEVVFPLQKNDPK